MIIVNELIDKTPNFHEIALFHIFTKILIFVSPDLRMPELCSESDHVITYAVRVYIYACM